MHIYKLRKCSKDSCSWEDVFEVEGTKWWLGCQAGAQKQFSSGWPCQEKLLQSRMLSGAVSQQADRLRLSGPRYLQVPFPEGFYLVAGGGGSIYKKEYLLYSYPQLTKPCS